MLKVTNLVYKINNKLLLKGISLELEPGKIYALTGANGSGKSTLLKCIGGLYQATEGEVSYNGIPLTQLSRKEIAKNLSLLPSSFSPAFNFTVKEIVGMGRFAHNTSLSHSLPYIKEALSAVNALHFLDRLFLSLSSGEQQRVLMARSLTTEASILLLDEPAATLDRDHEENLWQLLDQLKRQQKTIIAAIHHLEIAKPFLDEIILLKEGCIMNSFAI